MLRFNQSAKSETLPEPRNRKEFYLSLLAGHTPTKKKVLFSGYGKYESRQIPIDGVTLYGQVLIVNMPTSSVDGNTIAMVGDKKCECVKYWEDWYDMACCFKAYNDSEIWIHVAYEEDAANKVVISNIVELTSPQPKTATEFYLAKMAGIEVADHIEKVFEQEFTFGTEPGSHGDYPVIISNAYDEEIDASNIIAHIDGNNGNSSFEVGILGGGAVGIKAFDASYAGTTHTLEVFYKTVIEDVPVKTRTEQYLKAIAANQDSSEDDNGKEEITPVEGGTKK